MMFIDAVASEDRDAAAGFLCERKYYWLDRAVIVESIDC